MEIFLITTLRDFISLRKKSIDADRSLLDVRKVYNYEKEYRNNSVLILISHKKSNVYNDSKSE